MAPAARMDDGLFDVVVVNNIGKVDLMLNFLAGVSWSEFAAGINTDINWGYFRLSREDSTLLKPASGACPAALRAPATR